MEGSYASVPHGTQRLQALWHTKEKRLTILQPNYCAPTRQWGFQALRSALTIYYVILLGNDTALMALTVERVVHLKKLLHAEKLPIPRSYSDIAKIRDPCVTCDSRDRDGGMCQKNKKQGPPIRDTDQQGGQPRKPLTLDRKKGDTTIIQPEDCMCVREWVFRALRAVYRLLFHVVISNKAAHMETRTQRLGFGMGLLLQAGLPAVDPFRNEIQTVRDPCNLCYNVSVVEPASNNVQTKTRFEPTGEARAQLANLVKPHLTAPNKQSESARGSKRDTSDHSEEPPSKRHSAQKKKQPLPRLPRVTAAIKEFEKFNPTKKKAKDLQKMSPTELPHHRYTIFKEPDVRETNNMPIIGNQWVWKDTQHTHLTAVDQGTGQLIGNALRMELDKLHVHNNRVYTRKLLHEADTTHLHKDFSDGAKYSLIHLRTRNAVSRHTFAKGEYEYRKEIKLWFHNCSSQQHRWNGIMLGYSRDVPIDAVQEEEEDMPTEQDSSAPPSAKKRRLEMQEPTEAVSNQQKMQEKTERQPKKSPNAKRRRLPTRQETHGCTQDMHNINEVHRNIDSVDERMSEMHEEN